MAHMIESIAYDKVESPWHGLGVPVEADLTPQQMLEAANLDWEVQLYPNYTTYNKKKIMTGVNSLIRESDGRILTNVTDKWNPVQNIEAAEFFNEFVAAGDMQMNTAGSLCNGELVWFLAKMKESFDVFKNRDTIEAYCLFTNPHRYGWSTSVSLTAVRVVCANTLNLSLNTTKGDKIVKVNHRKVFNADEVKTILGVSKEKMKKYKEMAQFLASKKAKNEDIVEYFKRVFPVITTKEASKKEMSKPAQQTLDILHSQPGAEYGEGTWWSGYNAITYYMDHLAGRTTDSRLNSAWYGENRKKKTKALELAIDMAG